MDGLCRRGRRVKGTQQQPNVSETLLWGKRGYERAWNQSVSRQHSRRSSVTTETAPSLGTALSGTSSSLAAATHSGIEKLAEDFHRGPVAENPPANAGDHRFDPWSGKIPHATEQLSPSATTTEPVL